MDDELTQPAMCKTDSVEATRDSDSVDDFVYSTFERLRAQSVEPVSFPDGLMGREHDHESSSDVEKDHGGPTGRRPVVQFSCRSSPATSPDKSPGKMSAVSTGSGQTATPRTSPPAAAKWWHWECAGCDSKFCSKMLYNEHLLECPRAILGYPSAKDNNHISVRIRSADSLSINTTDTSGSKSSPTSAAGSPLPIAPNDLDTVNPVGGADVKLDDETDEGIALAKFLGAQAQDCSGRSLTGLERLKYSSLSPLSSATDNSLGKQGHGTSSQTLDYSGLDRSERLPVPALAPEVEEAYQLRRAQAHKRTRELAKECVRCLELEGRKVSAAYEVDTVSHQREINVTCGRLSSNVAHGQGRTTKHISLSIFDSFEDEPNVEGCVSFPV